MLTNRRCLMAICAATALIILAHISEYADNSKSSVDPICGMDMSYMIEQNESISLYNMLLQDLKGERVESAGDIEYPDYYGGAYIDKDTGALVIMIPENTQAPAEFIYRYTEKGASFTNCSVSYNSLNKAIKAIDIDFLRRKGINVVLRGIKEMDNTIYLAIEDYSEDKVNEILSYYPFPFLNVVSGEVHLTSTSLGAGYGMQI